ncbi:CRTAC1 family protein [Rubinisphaera sp.]|uniref:CRTAC1 family protein n=1 Tax=Rubinisphaera sp. TaxID=2024857 RepID=UPI000C0EE820|nr:CRTAC1 family protein [Rubinisphaera sp.]MBV11260.1 RNA-binding protein [Rubinisphaera sp.]HCS51183.1 CRTAC1 family protein [Planctomycetaceae bacterium]|tara:strand:+ start:25781 stop:27646 length:1866 start_codon:yes stop_codon:yes gene_type:complete
MTNLNYSKHDSEIDEEDDAVIGQAFGYSVLVILVLLSTGGISVYFFWPEASPEEIRTTVIEMPELRDRMESEIPDIPFEDITEEAGIHFRHENGAAGEKLLPETMGGGCAFFDCDNDGDQDILFINSKTWTNTSNEMPARTELYLNDGTGQFREAAQEWNINLEIYGMGVACGDYDNDGNTDVYITAVGSNRLLRNTGSSFEDVTELAGVAGGEEDWSTSAGWFDYDNDGRLDLFVCNYLEWSRAFDLNQNFQLIGNERAYGRPQFFPGAFCVLYHNEGNGQFRDVSQDAGIQITNPTTEKPLGKSLGVTFDDFDADGYLDIFVSNDTVHNFLFHNQQDGTFAEISIVAGVAYDSNGNARGAMGIDSSRFRNNNDIGIAIGNFANEMTALYVSPEKSLLFNDEAISNGLGPMTRLELTFGVFFFDADLDGRLDLMTANGHLEEDINKVQSSQYYEQPPQLFWNCGPDAISEFVPLNSDKTSEEFSKRLVGRGACYADIDLDGDLDILITTTGRTPRLLRNNQDTANNWIRFELSGTDSNRNAIGAVVKIKTETETLVRRIMPTRSYLSQVELPVTIGLGTSEQIHALEILWPGGNTEEFNNLEINRTYQIAEGASKLNNAN